MTSDRRETARARGQAEQALGHAATAPVPPVDPSFADRLAARLTAQHQEHADRRPSVAPWARPAVIGLASLLAVAAFVLLLPGGGGPRDLRLTAAVDTSVVLPDGTVLAASAGTALTEGTVIRVGPDGSATVDGQALPAGTIAVVVDGRVDVVSGTDGPSGGDEGVDPDRVARPPATSAEQDARDGDSTGDGAPPPTRPSPTSPTPSVLPPVTAPTTDTPTTRGDDSTTTTAPPERIDLQAARMDDRRVRLGWTPSRRADFHEYLVVLIQGDASRIVAEVTDRSATSFVDGPPRGDVAYRVLVVDRTDRVIGGSPLVSP